MAQHERRQVVDLEGRLVPVAGDPPDGVDAKPGVVDQHVKPVVIGADALGQAAHFLKRIEVRAVVAELVVAGLARDLRQRSLTALLASAVQQQCGPLAGELGGDGLAEPVGRAGDEDGLLVDGLDQSFLLFSRQGHRLPWQYPAGRLLVQRCFSYWYQGYYLEHDRLASGR